jgi:hypothetical protein
MAERAAMLIAARILIDPSTTVGLAIGVCHSTTRRERERERESARMGMGMGWVGYDEVVQFSMLIPQYVHTQITPTATYNHLVSMIRKGTIATNQCHFVLFDEFFGDVCTLDFNALCPPSLWPSIPISPCVTCCRYSVVVTHSMVESPAHNTGKQSRVSALSPIDPKLLGTRCDCATSSASTRRQTDTSTGIGFVLASGSSSTTRYPGDRRRIQRRCWVEHQRSATHHRRPCGRHVVCIQRRASRLLALRDIGSCKHPGRQASDIARCCSKQSRNDQV